MSLVAGSGSPDADLRWVAGRGVYIDGAWREAKTERGIEVLNPATGGSIGEIAAGGAADVDLAVRAARRAFSTGAWSRLAAGERGRLLWRLADLIEARAEELARVESIDGGNPESSVLGFDIPAAAATARDHAGWASKVSGEAPMTSPQTNGISYVSREPIGVVAAITPWNAPLLMAVRKVTAALAAGCTCVLKPAELAPLSSLLLADLIAEVGFPAGVFNLVTGHGEEAGRALAEHPDVDLVTFTGSTRVGRAIIEASARSNLKRMVLELGGKSPVFVFADAHLDRAAASIVKEICFKSGQYCAAGTRVYVEQPIHDRFVADIGRRLLGVRLGAGSEVTTEMGPLISAQQRDAVTRYVVGAAEEGAEIAAGGRPVERGGFFFEPTLVAGVRPGMRIVEEEVFGPVLCVSSFASEAGVDDLAAIANRSTYGLSAKIWSRDLGRVHALSRRIQAGSVIVNGGGGEGPTPSGGYKQSGFGREGGREGVYAFTETKSVRIGY